MSRVKHLTMLIVKLVLFVLVFALTAALVSMQTYPTDGIRLTDSFDESNIDVTLENGATLDWQIVDGELVFDITQSGNDYDDITVFLFFDEIAYDSSFIRSLLGDDAGKNEAFLSEMEEGPWLGHVNFSLKGETLLTTSRAMYSFCDDTLTEYEESVLSSEANKSARTEAFTVKKDAKTVMVGMIFGTEDTGALENGRYTLNVELKLGHPEGKKLDVGYLDVVSILLRIAGESIRNAGWSIFSITSWLTLYAVWVILGWFLYLWRDMRAVIGVFSSASLAGCGGIIKDVYVNGVYQGTVSEADAGVAVGILYAAIVWFILTITIPLRMLWYTIRDIIYLFKEDEVLEDFSYSGNLIGSVGIHVIFMGLAGVFGTAKIFGVIALIVGVAMCIAAHFLCRSKEY